MKPSYRFDLHRIMFGDLDYAFLGEVVFRTAIIYLYTLLLVRFLGKRGLGQLSPFDFVIVIALGSAVGDPMFYDDVPVIHCMVVITVVVVLQRLVSWLTDRNAAASRFINSEPRRLVHQGEVDLRALRDEQLDVSELFASLRLQGVHQLGQVERAYIEPSGAVSVIRRKEPLAGRPLIAHSDPDHLTHYEAGTPVPDLAPGFVCDWCGCALPHSPTQRFPERCPKCPSTLWVRASADG